MEKTIAVTVAPDGAVRVSARGYAGAACRDATRLLEAALGAAVAERLTAEFHQAQPAGQDLRQPS